MEDDKGRISVLNDISLSIKEEDHTMMNPIKWCISNNWVGDKVEFCGYNIPHPSEKVVHLSVQFEDKEIQTPKNVMKKMYESLECLEIIGTELLKKIDNSL